MEFMGNLIEGDIVDIYIRESLMNQKGYRQSIGKGEVATLRVASSYNFNDSSNVEVKKTIMVKEDKKGLIFPKMHIALSQLNHPILNLKAPPFIDSLGFQPASIHIVSLSSEDLEKAWEECFEAMIAQYDSLIKQYCMKGMVEEKDE